MPLVFALAAPPTPTEENPPDPAEDRARRARVRTQTGGALVATSVLLGAFWAPLAANADESPTAAAVAVGFGAVIGVQLGLDVGLVVSGTGDRRAR